MRGGGEVGENVLLGGCRGFGVVMVGFVIFKLLLGGGEGNLISLYGGKWFSC